MAKWVATALILVAVGLIAIAGSDARAAGCACRNWLEVGPRAKGSCTELLGPNRGFTEWSSTKGGTCKVCFAEFADCPSGRIEGWGLECASQEGTLRFTDAQSGRIAVYEKDEGRIIGDRNGRSVNAYWVEKSSATKCGYPIDGSYHWGRLVGSIAAGRSTWKWSYCEATPTKSWWVKCPQELATGPTPVPRGGSSDIGPKSCASSYGAFEFNGASQGLLARYGSDEGRLFGDIAGGAIDGVWVEKGSARKCKTPHDGSYHWGRFVGRLTPAGFSAKWSYCDAAPARAWTCK